MLTDQAMHQQFNIHTSVFAPFTSIHKHVNAADIRHIAKFREFMQRPIEDQNKFSMLKVQCDSGISDISAASLDWS